MTWLLRDGDVLASAEVASTVGRRSKGLLGLDRYQGAMVFPKTRAVHTFGMRFAIDVAFCDEDLVVVDVVTMRPWRMGRPRRHARCLIEAEAGAFGRWELRAGDQLEVRE